MKAMLPTRCSYPKPSICWTIICMACTRPGALTAKSLRTQFLLIVYKYLNEASKSFMQNVGPHTEIVLIFVIYVGLTRKMEIAWLMVPVGRFHSPNH